MKIFFVELDLAEQRFFSEQLSGHEVHFSQSLDGVPADAEAVSVFIAHELSETFLAAHPALRLIATRSSSLDHLDLAACKARGVTVCNVPHYSDTTVAEHTFALMLAVARRLREVMALPMAGSFSYRGTRGVELAEKTLGVIGMGRIGQRVAALAQAFHMKVIAYDVEPSELTASAFGFTYVPLPELFARADVITLHAPLRPETYHILNREAFAQCRRGVIVVNTARGALVDTAALREALDSGHVAGAGLDVLQDERVLRQSAARIIGAEIIQHLRSDALAQEARDANRLQELQEVMLGDAMLQRSNVIFTPHVAFNSIEAIRRLHEGTVENIRAFVGEKPQNVV